MNKHPRPRRLSALLLGCSLLGIVAGCDSAGGLAQNDSDGQNVRSSVGTTAPVTTRIGNYDVTFNGREVDAANPGLFKFRYTVTGTSTGAPLDDFFLQVPSCAGAPFVFADAFLGVDTRTGLSGVKWLTPLAANSSRPYVVGFFSDVPVGVVKAGVSAGGAQSLATIPGPCGQTETRARAVSGMVYVDADADATLDGTESGVPTVAVQLTSGALTFTTTTDAAGRFAFSVPDGTYTLSIPATSAGAFNAGLFASYNYTGTGSAERTVTIGPDVAGSDFGFSLDVEAVLQSLSSGAIATETEDAKFWTKQMRAASKGHRPKDVTLAALAGYLTRIEGLLLREPFQFGAGNKFAVALEVLDRPIRTPYDLYLQQLLTAELNVVSGRGSQSDAFNTALLGYGEAVAASSAPASLRVRNSASAGEASAALEEPATLEEATVVLDTFNRSGGGTTRPR